MLSATIMLTDRALYQHPQVTVTAFLNSYQPDYILQSLMPSCDIRVQLVCKVRGFVMAALLWLCAKQACTESLSNSEDVCRGCGVRAKGSPAAAQLQRLGCERCACTPGCPWRLCSTPAARPSARRLP